MGYSLIHKTSNIKYKIQGNIVKNKIKTNIQSIYINIQLIKNILRNILMIKIKFM